MCDCKKAESCDRPGKHPRVNDWPSLATSNHHVVAKMVDALADLEHRHRHG